MPNGTSCMIFSSLIVILFPDYVTSKFNKLSMKCIWLPHTGEGFVRAYSDHIPPLVENLTLTSQEVLHMNYVTGRPMKSDSVYTENSIFLLPSEGEMFGAYEMIGRC